VIGAAGAYSLLTAMTQVLVNLIDHGMSAVEAVSAPRIYCEGESIHAEARIPRAVCDELERAGSPVVRRHESYGYSFGYVQLIAIDEAGDVRGGSDPRKGGMALGL
jgi:gamma-glutamyltranspeptidase/glutathione hydrolase